MSKRLLYIPSVASFCHLDRTWLFRSLPGMQVIDRHFCPICRSQPVRYSNVFEKLHFGNTMYTVLTLSINRLEQTMQTQIRCHRMWHLIRIYTVCNSSSNFSQASTGSKIDLVNFLELIRSRVTVSEYLE